MMGKLRVDRINNPSSFKKIKKDWEQLYRSDPNSNVYISWLWMYGWFSATSDKWVVLGVKNVDTSAYVAFLPLTIFGRGYFGIYPIRRIAHAGRPISAYPGFLCSPDFEPEIIRVLAFYMQSGLRWDVFHLDWTKDPRLGTFLTSFPDAKFSIELSKGLTSLCITLPEDYQSYLKINIGNRTRRTIRHSTNVIQKNERYKIKYSTAETIDRDIEITCKLWFNRWHKEREMEWHRKILFYHFENDLLRLSMIWDGDIPVATLACLIDPVNKIYNAYIASYNPDYSKISPGIVLITKSIKQAIDENYKFYDLTLGMDPYKLSLGPKQYETENVSITRKRLKTAVTLMIMKQAGRVFRKLFK